MTKLVNLKNGLKAAALSSVFVAGSSFAALPKEVTDSLAAAKTDGVAVAGLVLGVIIAIMAFKYVRKAL